MVVAAEEFPAHRRGLAIGVVAAFSSFGAIVCAGLVPVLLRTAYGWRTVYFVAIFPLVTLAYARRGLKETRRFTEQGGAPAKRPLLHVWGTPHHKRVLQLGAVWFAAYLATQSTVTFWKDFAVTERGFTDAQVGAAISTAAVVALPLVFLMTRLLDVLGRRRSAALVFSLGAAATWSCYTLHGRAPLTVALVFGIFAASASSPILNALSTELFPTDIRADGFAWANSVLGRVALVLSPLVVGHLAGRLGWGPVVRSTAIFNLVTIALIYWLLPETKGRPLEETAAL